MIWIITYILSLICLSVTVDVSSMLFLAFVHLLGLSISYILGGKDKLALVKVYHCVFTLGSIYMLLTYLYMTTYNFDALLSYDASEYFIPRTKYYMAQGNLQKSLALIWSDYNLFDRNQAGYFSLAVLFGFLSNTFGVDFYLGQQMSVLFLYGFVGAIIYKLFIANKFLKNTAFTYTMLICVFSILFFYSSQVLRDTHILLLYLIGIYITFKENFSIFNILKIILVILSCMTVRVESGLFLVTLVPIYLHLSMKQSKFKGLILMFSIVIGLAGIIMSIGLVSSALGVVQANQEAYGGEKGDGVIGNLQKIPVAGDIASIIYNAVQPVPLWSRLSTSSINFADHAVYNIMNFPRSFASFFNWMVIVYIAFWIFNKKCWKRVNLRISLPLKYQLWIGFVFLFLQSDVVSQRRLLAYYVVFYILFFVIYHSTTYNVKRQVNFIVIFGFLMLQLIGLVFLR